MSGATGLIDRVAWSIPPGLKANTRPMRLLNELVAIGAVDSNVVRVHHGRAPLADAQHIRARSMWLPTSGNLRLKARVAYLSPVYVGRRNAVWQDFYDDWSIAPDINAVYQKLSALNYWRVGRRPRGLITANTPYMAEKVGVPKENIVPNGVDPALANLPRSGDDTPRLILLGHFFEGRTDWPALDQLVRSRIFDEVVIGAPGVDPRMMSLIEEWRTTEITLRVENWLSAETIAGMAGNYTYAAAMHLVTPYTLSQNLMKVYQFCALGIPVICTARLWPGAVDPAFGLPLRGPLRSHSELPKPVSDAHREMFVADNSWRVRAEQVLSLWRD